jgi:predicted CoA-binding protein
VGDVAGMDNVAEQILTTYDTITVVGASAHPVKAAHRVPATMQRLGWRVIPVNLRGGTIFGERAYRALAEVPEQVGLVDVFRPSWQAADIARQAVAAGATALWLQLGISSVEAREVAESAGLLYVEDRCLAVELRRLGLDAPSPRGTASGGSRAKALKDRKDNLPVHQRAGLPQFRKRGRCLPTMNYTRHGFTLRDGALTLAGGIAVRVGARAKTRLLLSERTYKCGACGTVLPRDKNSAAVMLVRAGLNPAGADRVRRAAA